MLNAFFSAQVPTDVLVGCFFQHLTGIKFMGSALEIIKIGPTVVE